MSTFFNLIPIVEELPPDFYEMHHLLWEEINEIMVDGKRCSCMSAVSWWKIAVSRPVKTLKYVSLNIDIPVRYLHDEEIGVEYMCVNRVTDLIRGLHFKLFVDIGEPRDPLEYFEAFYRAENRVFELVQQRGFMKDVPENYLCKEYVEDGAFTPEFCFDMDTLTTTTNRLYFRYWRTRDAPLMATPAETDKLRQKIQSEIDISTSRFLQENTERVYFSLMGSEAYFRIYKRLYPQIEHLTATPKVIMMGLIPDLAETIPKDISEWRVGHWNIFLELCFLQKLGNALTFERFGRDPVKTLFREKVEFDTARCMFLYEKKNYFRDALEAYCWANEKDPENYPSLW